MREITEACSRSTIGLDRGAGGLRGGRRAAPARRGAQAPTGRGDRDGRASPTTPSSTGSSRAPGSAARAGLRRPARAPGPIVAAASAREPAELPPRGLAEEGQMARRRGRPRGVPRRRPARSPARPPLHPSPHAGDVRFGRLDRSSPLSSIGASCTSSATPSTSRACRPTSTARLDTPSLGAHESQSRFWENQVGHARVLGTLEPYLRRR